MRLKFIFTFLFYFTFQAVYGQLLTVDTIDSYSTFKNKFVLFSDLGVNTSPFSLHFNSANSPVKKLAFRNNLPLVFGIGFAYRGLGLRLNLPIIKDLRKESKFGTTSYFGIGLDFPIKKMHFDIEYKHFIGYSIKDAYKIDPSLPNAERNLHNTNTATFSFSLESYYFHDKNLRFGNVKGKIGHYNKEVRTWYLKGHFNVLGLNELSQNPIIPAIISDSNNSKTFIHSVSAFDVGVIPGYAYVNRISNWQFATLIAFGPVVQSKFYKFDDTQRGFLGLSPKYDIQLFGGYNTTTWFVMLHTIFDNKFILFKDLKYYNFGYSLRLVGGYRFPTKREKRIENEKLKTNQEK